MEGSRVCGSWAGSRAIAALCFTGLCATSLLEVAAGQDGPQDHAPVEFNRDVRPILAEHCFACHGPDAADRKARLRLDVAGGEDGAYRESAGTAAIAPGSLDDSELWYRITTEFEDEVMPPPEAHGEPLDADELDIVKRWIEKGAPYADHWAFVPPRDRAAQGGAESSWGTGSIDSFVLASLQAEGLAPAPRADRRTLIRRATLDITGLPPTQAEIEAFLSDEGPGAYGRLVDGLLARPQYGEHMARFWLDLVRFADTNGIHHDHFRDLSPYRDYVIRSFNGDLPYDRFVTEQLAGDLLPEPTPDQLTASGFHRLHLVIDIGTMLPEESLARNTIDRVTSFGTAFLGLTLQCAVCHDHKYDPIRQKDVFQLYAFFNNVDGPPETGRRQGPDFERGIQRPYRRYPTEDQTARLAELDLAAEDAKAKLAALEEEDADREALDAEIKRLSKERDAVEALVRAVMVMQERSEPRPAFIFERGAYDQLGEPVERDTPAFLPPLEKADGAGAPTRLDLARWVVAEENPLTARVAVNRFWQQFFGVGLVKTAEDFGTRGEWPRHSELLDHLAVTFRESGWSVKELVRRIVTSETYRQSSVAPAKAFVDDPENRLLARGSRYRLDAEVIRDQVLATSGLLSPKMFGKSVKPPQPSGIWKAVALPDSYPRVFQADEGEAVRRRSVYTFWKRALAPPQLTILNAPNRESCVARRERTNTPLQALLLMNEEEFLKAARHLAKSALEEGPKETELRLDWIYERVTARLPDAAVRATLLAALEDLGRLYENDPALTTELCEGAALPPDMQATELAAWTMVASAIHNLDVTRTRD